MDFTGRVMKGIVFVDTDALITGEQLEYWITLAPRAQQTGKAIPEKETGTAETGTKLMAKA